MKKNVALKVNKLFVIARDLKNYEKLSRYVGRGKDGVVYVVKTIENGTEYLNFYSTKKANSERIDIYELEVNGLKGVVMTAKNLNLLQMIKNHVFVDCIMRQIDIYMPYLIDVNNNEINYLRFIIEPN